MIRHLPGLLPRRGAALIFALALASCVQTVTVNTAVPLRDGSAKSPDKHAYTTVMVLPPSGGARGEAPELSALERALLKRGVRIISSGVTGRVVVEETDQGRGTQGATGLSDLERALVLARKSNADCILQVTELTWKDSSRYFIPTGEGGSLDEAKSREEYLAASAQRRFSVISPRLTFIGKLIDVETGEVVVSVDLSRSVGDVSVPASYKITSREFNVNSSTARESIVAEVMDALAQIVSSGPPRAPTAAPPPPPPAPSASAAPSAGTPPKKKR